MPGLLKTVADENSKFYCELFLRKKSNLRVAMQTNIMNHCKVIFSSMDREKTIFNAKR